MVYDGRLVVCDPSSFLRKGKQSLPRTGVLWNENPKIRNPDTLIVEVNKIRWVEHREAMS